MNIAFIMFGLIVSMPCYGMEPQSKKEKNVFMHKKKTYFLASVAQTLSIYALVEESVSLSESWRYNTVFIWVESKKEKWVRKSIFNEKVAILREGCNKYNLSSRAI